MNRGLTLSNMLLWLNPLLENQPIYDGRIMTNLEKLFRGLAQPSDVVGGLVSLTATTNNNTSNNTSNNSNMCYIMLYAVGVFLNQHLDISSQ